MVKTVKVALSLPKPVMTWLQERADEKYLTANDYLRGLIIDLYVGASGVHGRSSGSPGDDSSTTGDRHKTPKLPGTRSGYKGVYPYGRKWAAVVSWDGRQERVAVCDTPEEAARAYDQAMIARAGGDPRAAVNAIADRGRAAALVDQPYVQKLMHGQRLTDVEMAAWKRASAAMPEAPSALPVTSTTAASIDDGGPLVATRRQLRRGSAPAIERPVDDDNESNEDGA